jgi:cation:H+ antiporter
MIVPIAMVLGGLVLLSVSADRFVVAAARLSRLWGLSPILIGALVVGMGTSAPELLVSVLAASTGEIDLALGNVIGSNVANVTLVLGVTAVLAPVSGELRVLRREGVLMLVAVVAFAAALFDLQLLRWEGLALAASMLAAAYLVVRWGRRDKARGLPLHSLEDDESEPVKWASEILWGVVALAATLLGAELLVDGAVTLSDALGIASAFVGLTLVAVGTSLPELATSIAAIRRKEGELVVGNVLGSNLFNALAVGGMSGAISPGGVAPSLGPASWAMVGAAAVAGLLAYTGRTLVRWEGIVLLLGFGVFVYLSY